MRRRALLQSTAATTALGSLAGCLDSLSGDSTDTETTTDDTETTTDDTETNTESTTTAPALAVESKTIETTNTDCGSENSGRIEFTDSGATITGSVQANTPCHEAQYVDERVLGGVLEVTIGTTESDADAEACQECIAHVEYSGTITTNVDPHSLVLVHEYTPEDADEPVTEVVADKTHGD
jgi:hypothetical protein